MRNMYISYTVFLVSYRHERLIFMTLNLQIIMSISNLTSQLLHTALIHTSFLMGALAQNTYHKKEKCWILDRYVNKMSLATICQGCNWWWTSFNSGKKLCYMHNLDTYTVEPHLVDTPVRRTPHLRGHFF